MRRVFRVNAKGKRRIPGEMSKTELAYSQYLELRKRANEIQDWWYEPLSFRLAKQTNAILDFMILDNDGFITMVDTKGSTKVTRKDGTVDTVAYSMDKSKAKIKIAADMFPFRFVFSWFDKRQGTWMEQEF